MAGRSDGLIKLMRELDAARSITLARAREVYGGGLSEATWKRVKKRLEREGCVLKWIAKERRFVVADPLWSLNRGTAAPARLRDRLTMLRAEAAALGSPYADELAPFFERWDSQLAGKDDAAPPVVHRPQPRADGAFFERLTQVEAALRDHRMIAFTYTNTAGGKPKDRQIEPYALHEHVGRFYVWGREKVRQAPKFFAVDLMRDVSLEDGFDPDPAVSLSDALEHSFGMYVGQPHRPMKVVVEIDASRASYVRARRWPAEVCCEDGEDGELRLTFSVNDPQEVVSWVLGFGGTARILSPPSAADLARRAAEGMALAHGWSRQAARRDGMMEFEWPKES